MLSVKPLPQTSPASLSFLLRFYQRYNSWVLVNFNFLAESRSDMEGNYYEIGNKSNI
jgi:hypothetical protein